MVKNPVAKCTIHLILQDFDFHPLTYKIFETNKDGSFEVNTPIFPFINY